VVCSAKKNIALYWRLGAHGRITLHCDQKKEIKAILHHCLYSSCLLIDQKVKIRCHSSCNLLLVWSVWKYYVHINCLHDDRGMSFEDLHQKLVCGWGWATFDRVHVSTVFSDQSDSSTSTSLELRSRKITHDVKDLIRERLRINYPGYQHQLCWDVFHSWEKDQTSDFSRPRTKIRTELVFPNRLENVFSILYSTGPQFLDGDRNDTIHLLSALCERFSELLW
jgi:hypothetical protein